MLSPIDMDRIAQPYRTKSDKIRALARADVARADIARYLGVRYQYVRNVLEQDLTVGRAKAPTGNVGVREPGAAFEPARVTSQEKVRIGNLFRLTVGTDGSIQLPSDVMEAFALEPGDIIVADLDGAVFSLLSREESLRRARSLLPAWKPGEPLWSELLIEERQRETKADGDGV